MSAVRRSGVLVSGILVAVAFVALVPAAYAQSAFTGVVRDTSGAVLPGVTVDVTSPVLIEGTKSATTDASGAYRIVDLRPGTYTVTFSLPGFKTARFEGVELRTDFTATFNANLEVGALEESVTVTGASPVVDVSSNSKVEVLTREVLDQVPTGRTIQAYAQLVSGVTLNVPDVGGSRGMQQTYMSTRGLTSANNIVTVDGLMVNGLDGDGAVQQYFNQAMVQEMSYQTSGAGADVSPGGVRMAIVSRDGGNQFNGSFFAGYTTGDWMSNNLSQDLIDRGLRRAGGIDRIYDINAGIGGPIKRDKLWFFGSARAWSVDAPIANTFFTPENLPYAQGFAACQSGAANCEQGLDDQSIESALLRLTWQVSPSHKISAYYDEINKYRGHGMNAGDDPRTASQIWTSPRYNSAALKYTGTLSSSLLLEGGYSFNYEEYVITNQDGVNKTAFSPEWYAGASRRDANLATLYSGLANWGGRYPDRFALSGSLSYVTGSHNLKVGIQDNWGPYVNTREANADLQQVYLSGVPNSVTDLQHTAALQGQPRRRHRHLRAGHLDGQSADAERRHPVGVHGRGSLRLDVGAGPLRARADLRRHPDAHMEGLRSAGRRRVRPVRQRQDGAQVRHQSLQRVADDAVRGPLQPAHAAEREPELDGPEPQRCRRGQPRLHLPVGGLRDELRTDAAQLRHPLAQYGGSRLPAHLQLGDDRRHPARAVPARLGLRHLVSPEVLRPARHRQPAPLDE